MSSKSKLNMSDIIAARSALLEYYSGKASAFGGFFLASIFGLVSLLAIIHGLDCGPISVNGLFFGTVLIGFSCYGFLAFFIIPKIDVGKYQIGFIHFLFYFLMLCFSLASLFFFVKNILLLGITWADVLIGLSILPVLTFSYFGYFVIQRFSHYSRIGGMIETGFLEPDEELTLFSVANINEELFWHIPKEESKPKKVDLSKFIAAEDIKQKKLLGKLIITNNNGLKIAYWFLITTLVLLIYGTKFFVN